MDNIPTDIDLTRFTELDLITVNHEWDLKGKINDGWVPIAIGTVRPRPNSDGSFTDTFTAVIGREES
jgi:hypothetical protein